jgi:hypothetical protein
MPQENSPQAGAVSANPIETALNEVSVQLGAAERKKEYKTKLDSLLQITNGAMAEYSGKKYQELLKRWKDLDDLVTKLQTELTASFPQWETQLKTSVGPLFATLTGQRQQLGQRTEPAQPSSGKDSLYTQRDRQQVQLELAQAHSDQALAALMAWASPARNIEKVLSENERTASEIGKMPIAQPDAATRLYDMFFKLLPMHWLIAPPSEQERVNPEKYVVKVAGAPSWEALLQMLGPQPRLIEPSAYLAQLGQHQLKQYKDAQNALAKADGALKGTLEEIKRIEKALDKPLDALEKNAKAALLDPLA